MHGEISGFNSSPELNCTEAIERQAVCNGVQAECCDHQADIEDQFDGIPLTAIHYLNERCSAPHILPIAIESVQGLLAEMPDALDDPDLAALELDVCLEKAENSVRLDTLKTEQDANEQRRTTIAGLKTEIAANVQGKSVPEQLQAAQSILAEKIEAGLSAEVAADLQAWLDGLTATLAQMSALVTEPNEAAALRAILRSTSLNLAASNNCSAFTDVLAQVNQATEISDATKANLHVEVFGVPSGYRDSGELLQTLDLIATKGGQYLNPNGELVPFNQENGLPLGDYTVYPSSQQPDRFFADASVAGRTLRLSFGRDVEPSHLDRLIMAAMVSQVLANRDLQAANRYILGGDGLAAQGVSEIKLDEYQTARAERLYGAFMGFGVEARTGFPSQTDLHEFERRLQATHIDGDAKTGNNTRRGDLSWQEVGMLETNGDLNMNTVEAVGAFINQNPDALPDYNTLVEQFGQTDED